MSKIELSTIARSVRRIREDISDAALKCGRRPKDIKLIAVSKTKAWPMVDEAIQAEQRIFGENTVQDAMTKIPHFRYRGVEWHFIGHLQSKKARFIPGNFDWVHSVDSLHLTSKLSQAAERVQRRVNILIQVNVTADANKYGVSPEHVFALVESMVEAKLPGLQLRGLMTIGLHQATEREARAVFAQLRRLRDACADRFDLHDFTELSMGMSGDYVPAIMEGSTMIRIGTAVFGERVYPP